jgi:hypothetical protein
VTSLSKITAGAALFCAFSKSVDAMAGAPSFKNNVQPIFDANCVSRHQAGSAAQNLVRESVNSYTAIGNRPSTEARLMLVAPGAPASS